MSNTRSAAKKTATSSEVVKSVDVVPVAEELSNELKLLLDIEQQKLELATMQGQLAYLSNRVAELTTENYALKSSED